MKRILLNTEVSYKRDLTKLFYIYLNTYSTDNISDITKEELEGYISSLETIEEHLPNNIKKHCVDESIFWIFVSGGIYYRQSCF